MIFFPFPNCSTTSNIQNQHLEGINILRWLYNITDNYIKPFIIQNCMYVTLLQVYQSTLARHLQDKARTSLPKLCSHSLQNLPHLNSQSGAASAIYMLTIHSLVLDFCAETAKSIWQGWMERSGEIEREQACVQTGPHHQGEVRVNAVLFLDCRGRTLTLRPDNNYMPWKIFCVSRQCYVIGTYLCPNSIMSTGGVYKQISYENPKSFENMIL